MFLRMKQILLEKKSSLQLAHTQPNLSLSTEKANLETLAKIRIPIEIT